MVPSDQYLSIFLNIHSFIVISIPSSDIISFLMVAAVIIFSGLVSGSETAFFSLDEESIKTLSQSDNPKHQLIIKQLEKPQRLLSTIIVSNYVFNIIAILLFFITFPDIFSGYFSKIIVVLLKALIISLALLLFSEILPKIYARQQYKAFINLMIKPLILFSWLFYPLVIMVEKSQIALERKIQKHKGPLTMSELSDVVEMAENNEQTTEEVKILKGITTYGETEVSEIMKARVDVAALNANLTFAELIDYIKEWGYSRFPVFEDTFDNVKGILHIKDLLPHLHKEEFQWKHLIREPFFIPENKKINDLLQDFKTRKNHLAIVVDEYGGTSGIVTLEDVLEEIMGEISDEFDVKELDNQFVKVSDQTWVVDAKTSINDLCKYFDFDLDFFDEVKGESDSLAGLVLEINGDFPAIGERLTFKNCDFEVVLSDNKRIKKVKIQINE
ncbi:MAG: gliding motility-associated protein GldE [Bacteroidales bacterium]|nr:gliding motility-associated protein GldE [Bacteroidales bacterium]